MYLYDLSTEKLIVESTCITSEIAYNVLHRGEKWFYSLNLRNRKMILDYLNTKTGAQGRRIVAGSLVVFWVVIAILFCVL